MNFRPTYTVSAIETFLRCEKEYELKFVHGIEAVSSHVIASPSALLRAGSAKQSPEIPREIATSPAITTGRAPRNDTHNITPQQRGILVHEVMQFLDMPSLSNRETVIAQALWNQHIADPEGKIRGEMLALTEKMFAQEEIRSLFDGARHFLREIPFLLDLKNFYIRGKIDALIQSDEETLVFDYKTDRVGSLKEALARSEAYRGQMACYALACSLILHRIPVRTVLLFTQGPHLVRQEWNEAGLSQIPRLLEGIYQKLVSSGKEEKFVYPTDKKICLHCPYFELDYCGVKSL